MTVSDIRLYTDDTLELQNPVAEQKGEEPPTLLFEVGVWNMPTGQKSGIAVSAFGELAPLIEPQDARRLAKWLLAAADTLSGEKKQKGRKGPRRAHWDDEDDAY